MIRKEVINLQENLRVIRVKIRKRNSQSWCSKIGVIFLSKWQIKVKMTNGSISKKREMFVSPTQWLPKETVLDKLTNQICDKNWKLSRKNQAVSLQSTKDNLCSRCQNTISQISKSRSQLFQHRWEIVFQLIEILKSHRFTLWAKKNRKVMCRCRASRSRIRKRVQTRMIYFSRSSKKVTKSTKIVILLIIMSLRWNQISIKSTKLCLARNFSLIKRLRKASSFKVKLVKLCRFLLRANIRKALKLLWILIIQLVTILASPMDKGILMSKILQKHPKINRIWQKRKLVNRVQRAVNGKFCPKEM